MRLTSIALAFCAFICYARCTFLEDLKAVAVINIVKYPPPIAKLKTLQALIKSKAFLPPKVFEKLMEKYNRENAEIEAEKVKRSSIDKGKGPEVEKKVKFLLPEEKTKNASRVRSEKHRKNGHSNDMMPENFPSGKNKSAVSNVNGNPDQKMDRGNDSSKYCSLPISTNNAILSRENSDRISEDLGNDINNDEKNGLGLFKDFCANFILAMCGGNKKNYECPELIREFPPLETSQSKETVDVEPAKPTLSEEDKCLLSSTIVAYYLNQVVDNFDNGEKKVALQMENITGVRGSLSLWIDKYVRNVSIKKIGRSNVVAKKYRENELHWKEPAIENIGQEFHHLCEVALKDYFGDELITLAKSSKLNERKKNRGICQLSFKSGDVVTLLIEKAINPTEGYFISVLLSVHLIRVVDFVKLSEEPELQNKRLVVGQHLSDSL